MNKKKVSTYIHFYFYLLYHIYAIRKKFNKLKKPIFLCDNILTWMLLYNVFFFVETEMFNIIARSQHQAIKSNHTTHFQYSLNNIFFLL